MRYFSKFISAVLMLILAIACNTKEIDNPDNSDKPQISDNIKIAASIKQTRVSFSVDNNELVPDWEEGDVIFGYYGTGDGRIVFTVTGVDETTGIASLEATSESDWEYFLAEYKTAGNDLRVGLIYTGTKVTDKDNLFANGNSVSVTMTSQTGENIPACMHATSFETAEDDEGQIIRFLFDNDCAIFEIESLTGIAEDAGLGENETLKLKSLTVTNLIPTYEYSYANGELSCQSGTSSPTTYTITLPENIWTLDYEGNINRTDNKNLLVAVAPNTTLEDILITATATDGMNSREFSYLYNGNLDAGECYIIKKRDVVAKTEDGQYFTSVSAAFDHAAVLSDQGYNTASKNVVTLIKKEIDGFGEQKDSQTHMSSIEIDYPVTLDLNGCTLSLSGAEGFEVTFDSSFNPATFTITDGNGLIDAAGYDGNIESTSSNPIIINYGDVIIDGGELYFTFSDKSYYERYCMIDNEGGTITINNHSFLQAEGDSEVNTELYLIKNDSEGEVNINNGDLYSYDAVNTIYNLEGTVTMSGGELYSRNEDAILNEADGIVNIVDGDIDSGGFYSIENRGIVTISGGNIYKYEDDDQRPTNDHPTIYNTNQLIVSGGIISSSLNYAVYCEGGSIEMSDGEISCSHLYSGAVVLSNAGNSSISGGTLTSSGEATISVTNVTTLDVSGGIIINTNSNAKSAIEIDARNDGKLPTLIVRWPGEDVTDQPDGVLKPLLYSKKGASIQEKSSYSTFYSTVYIKGGFLYSAANSKYFYAQDNQYRCLKPSSGYYFYSNTSSMYRTYSDVTASSSSLSPAKSIDASDTVILGVLSFNKKIAIVPK